jgi:hypothetical protein
MTTTGADYRDERNDHHAQRQQRREHYGCDKSEHPIKV